MKYEYKIAMRENFKLNSGKKLKSAAIVNVVTSGYILSMHITDLLIKHEWPVHEKGVGVVMNSKPEFEFTGAWRVTYNDSNKEDTKLLVEIKHNYTVISRRKNISSIINSGWKRLFNKYKEVSTIERLPHKDMVSKVWVSADDFEFRSLFHNECTSCNE